MQITYIALFTFNTMSKIQLSERKKRYPPNVAREILEIFDKRTGSTYMYQEGLVDALDSDDFYAKLERLKERWIVREKENVGVLPDFHQ